jgi:hypothetical protein
MNEDCQRLARRARRAPLLLSLLLALPLYAGCQGFDTPFSTASNDDDPLRPGGRIPENVTPRPPQAVATNTNTNAPKNNPSPSQPSTLPGRPTGNTPAELASSGTKSTTAADDVRAKGPPGATDGASAWQSPGGAPLRGVESVGEAGHPSESGTGTVLHAGGVQRAETLEQAFELLKKNYGMNWSKLTQLGNSDQYQFECSIPHRTAANMSQYYDGRGVGALGAVRNVLDKVMQEQGGN